MGLGGARGPEGGFKMTLSKMHLCSMAVLEEKIRLNVSLLAPLHSEGLRFFADRWRELTVEQKLGCSSFVVSSRQGWVELRALCFCVVSVEESMACEIFGRIAVPSKPAVSCEDAQGEHP